MKRDPNDIDRLLSLLNAVDKSILDLSDDEIRAELVNDGKRPGERVEEIIQRQLASFRKRRLAAAKRGASLAREARTSARWELPDDPALRRQLLEAVIANDAARVPKQFTRAFSDGTEITDAEVDSIIAALITLGVLEKNGQPK